MFQDFTNHIMLRLCMENFYFIELSTFILLSKSSLVGFVKRIWLLIGFSFEKKKYIL